MNVVAPRPVFEGRSSPSPRRPPLADLHAFEAAARHLSFTRAASELGVTQGAVSQRVRKLEETLGLRLFKRLARALRLTAEGEILAKAVRDGIDRIDVGLGAIGGTPQQRRGTTLTLSVAPGFACRWLLPRLARFRARYPDIEVRLEAEDRLANFAGDGVDLAIRCGKGTYPGLQADLLMSDAVFPVCNPTLLERGPRLVRPEDLFSHVLLHDSRTESDGGGSGWNHWFASAGLPVRRHDGPRFSNAHLAIEAAISGLGIALGRATLVNDELIEGRLVRPLRHAAPTIFSYYLVRRPASVLSPPLAEFVAWLREEAESWCASASRARIVGVPD
jgi:LysR family transcriptional regulator, glycine cleavage system transcriptional activator